MKRVVILLTAAVASMQPMWGWSQKGHDVTAYIAEQHLTAATAAAVDSLLEGRSMVYWANWLDNASYQPELSYTRTWHYKNVEAGCDYEQAVQEPKGDVVTALRQEIGVLARGVEAALAESQLALKIIIHLMGDLHQPMHLGRLAERGGNEVKVKFFGKETNLHALWDSSLPEAAHKWSYSEWQQQIDRPATYDMAAAVAGNIDDWARASMLLAREQYVYFQPGTKASYNHIARWTTTIERQFLLGGLRLAHVLNIIFDADYRSAHNIKL